MWSCGRADGGKRRSAIDIVAQMGAEPYLKALGLQSDIILGGRSYDPAPYAAISMYHGVQPAVAWHMGKTMECGGICAIPKGRSMVAPMREDSFDLTPLSPKERCTPLSVAAHTLLSSWAGGCVKLEGVEKLGYHIIFIRGIRNPILISQINAFLHNMQVYTQNLFPELD
ncbi:hypothetical protein AWENTII_006307 [Aspergillus wentii]